MFEISRIGAKVRHHTECVALTKKKKAKFRRAKSGRIFQHGLKYWLQIAG